MNKKRTSYAKRLCGGISGLALLFAWGSVGALDQGTISLGQGAAQILFGMGLCGLLGYISWRLG